MSCFAVFLALLHSVMSIEMGRALYRVPHSLRN